MGEARSFPNVRAALHFSDGRLINIKLCGQSFLRLTQGFAQFVQGHVFTQFNLARFYCGAALR